MSKRARQTVKVTISIAAHEQQGRQALADWLGAFHPEPTKAELDAIRTEWAGERPQRPTRARTAPVQ